MVTRRLTRRQLGLAAAAVAVPASSAAAQQAAAPAGDLDLARANTARNSAALRKFELPQLVEPSFVFRP
jgi:hypothetical protein